MGIPHYSYLLKGYTYSVKNLILFWCIMYTRNIASNLDLQNYHGAIYRLFPHLLLKFAVADYHMELSGTDTSQILSAALA